MNASVGIAELKNLAQGRMTCNMIENDLKEMEVLMPLLLERQLISDEPAEMIYLGFSVRAVVFASKAKKSFDKLYKNYDEVKEKLVQELVGATTCDARTLPELTPEGLPRLKIILEVNNAPAAHAASRPPPQAALTDIEVSAHGLSIDEQSCTQCKWPRRGSL